jgi:RNA-directed DNA polymerase
LAAAKLLSAIYEQDFLECSFGYRNGISALDAVRDITVNLMRGKYSFIVDADIKGFFDNIDHDWLLQMLEERIDDKTFIRLIRKWLKAGILDAGNISYPDKGTPQGGIVSPVLSNIYLHYALDLWFDKVIKPSCEGMEYICRYADDFVCAFQYKREAETFFGKLDARLGKFKLELSKEKTRIISFSRFRKEENTSFDFLGFEFRWGLSRKGNDVVKRRTSCKKFKQSLRNFTDWIKSSRNKRINTIFKTLNMKLRGYYNYYGICGNIKSLLDFFNGAMRLLFKWLNRRSQRRSFNYAGFRELCKYFRVLRPRIVEQPISAFIE